MIYSLYHWWTNTPMEENGLPWYIDVLGGILDAVLVVGLLMVLSSGPAMAATNITTTTQPLNQTAPYYVNQTTIGNQSSWFPQVSAPNNVSLDALGQFLLRLGPFIIGHGSTIPNGTTYAGTILTGLLMIAIFMGVFTLTGIGMSGGIVAAATVGYGLTDMGFAPPWFKVVLLFIIGLTAAVAFLRTTT